MGTERVIEDKAMPNGTPATRNGGTPASAKAASGNLAELAQEHGLWRIGVRPGLVDYLKQVWRFRQFTGVLATSRAYAQNQNAYLGQLWAVITPILNAAVYVFIFGIILETDRGVENVIAFIVIGVFMFRFFQQSVSTGGKSVESKVQLVRSLHFPRAILPIGAVLTELTSLVPALAVMCAITWGSGYVPGYAEVDVTVEWLLLPLAVILYSLFNAGCAMIAARVVAVAPDVMNVIQFVMRLLMYGSGVLFSIDHYVTHDGLAALMQYQPIAVYLALARSALTQEPNLTVDPSMWLWGAGWGVLFLVVGFIFFWRGEERYGRD